jgi:hypothetical protein
VLPRGQRTWIQISAGPGKGVWIKVEPYWEPGYLQGEPEPLIQEILAEKLKRATFLGAFLAEANIEGVGLIKMGVEGQFECILSIRSCTT